MTRFFVEGKAKIALNNANEFSSDILHDTALSMAVAMSETLSVYCEGIALYRSSIGFCFSLFHPNGSD